MFEYKNLPDTVPAYLLELYLQIFGYAAFTEIRDPKSIVNANSVVTEKPGIYIMYGALGGERDIYYRPRLFTSANPRISYAVQRPVAYDVHDLDTIESGDPVVIMRNDTNMSGLIPLFSRYASQLLENDISIRSAQINARAQVGISVTTDRDHESALKYLDSLEAGKLAIIGESSFLEGIEVSNVSTQSSNAIIQLIELQQYLKASWFNELGLNVNFNMKREYMSEEEIAVNTDILLPLIDDMLQSRLNAIEAINKAFGLNIEVSKSSAWANKEQEDLAALAEASMSGNIPLSDTIKEKIGGKFDNGEQVSEKSVETESAREEQVIQTVVQGEEAAAGLGTGTTGPSDDGDPTSGPPDVTVQVNINLGEGETEDVAVFESTAPEKSEEPDDK